MRRRPPKAVIKTFVFECKTSDGVWLKPRFGDIDGIVFADLPSRRTQCLNAVNRRIALCRENIEFSYGKKNEDFGHCLPIFRTQAQECVRHFTFERLRCGGGGNEASEAAELEKSEWRRVQESLLAFGFNPGPLDGKFGPKTQGAVQAWQQANGYPATGVATYSQIRQLLDHGSGLESFGPNWSFVENQPCQVYNPVPRPAELVTWSGGCVDGKAAGWGRLVRRGPSGENVYEGELSEGVQNGYGSYLRSNGQRYDGEWRDGRPDGHGVWTGTDGESYEGELLRGVQNGEGTYTWANGDRYGGEWRDAKPHGHGIWTGANGDHYEGESRGGMRSGYGTYTWANGDRYEGEFREGLEHGRGTWTGANGGRYEGEWRFGKRSADKSSHGGLPGG